MEAGKVPASEHTSPEIRVYQLNLTAHQGQFIAMLFAAGPKPTLADTLALAFLVRQLGDEGIDNLRDKLITMNAEIGRQEFPNG